MANLYLSRFDNVIYNNATVPTLFVLMTNQSNNHNRTFIVNGYMCPRNPNMHSLFVEKHPCFQLTKPAMQ